MNLPPLRMLFFEDLAVGMSERLSKTVASSDVVGFAQLTGDRNPIHLSEHFAAKTSFGRRIAHGLYTASLISAVLGTRLPGPGAVYISQTLNFRAPDRRHCGGDGHRRRAYSGKIPGAIVLRLRGRRRGGSGRRGAGEGPEQEGSEGKAATDAAIAGRKRPTGRAAAADAPAEAC
jgi:MaoC like domain